MQQIHLKKVLQLLFYSFLFIILIGKISGWIWGFDNEYDGMINLGTFVLIGAAYISAAIAWNSNLYRWIFLICGIYLIVMNFLDFELKSILGIACILTPLLLSRISSEKPNQFIEK
ncbi:MAG TPA: hypothetical protein DEQ87_05445 [Algoriphagus sp.]|mgnify:FL=1|jgi:hypothetical protein|uniref:hypothetical protein n=1 Tax=unclassified Algoriphagus TaxID=2641541 RepID=UPI000C433444|nr:MULTISPECIES: hypothetical protein [unclassified Algoriphagus]MAL15802.1 hypothetical protein [Algoriphagus sp.]QYH40780.1 hypothetical protein GYM62_18980 [Algoriphagus sp. NBT04N3]HAD51877.1 hypothetical protein [Algoriphagus sp.]HAH36269.1 hypothetical protein [Algoriphagus sp.]HAS59971.1 hypothetical protein [Algoriphagus sp.]|tara:strand:- start:760 stop:1107 length:348 start_codon:yes stop_codon:yes gene_type:complete